MAELVEAFDEIDGFEVFVAAITIRDPLSGFSRVIEIEHRCNRVDSKTINVIMLEPEECVTDQEITDFGASIIEDLGAPVTMFAKPWIFVFIKMGSVEIAETMDIARKVRGHPI